MNIELSDKELSLVKFALWGMINVAYDRANREAQVGTAVAVSKFLDDAKRCEDLLARLKNEQHS